MYVSKYTTKLVLNSWLSFDWNTYDYVHISSTIEIYSGVLSGVEKVPFFTPESRSGESTKLGGSPQHWLKQQTSRRFSQITLQNNHSLGDVNIDILKF